MSNTDMQRLLIEQSAYLLGRDSEADQLAELHSRLTAAETARDAALAENTRLTERLEDKTRSLRVEIAAKLGAYNEIKMLEAERDAALAHVERLEKALPYISAQLRHAYTHLNSGTVGDLKQFADGLIAPQIRRLEDLSPAAEEAKP